MLVKTGNLTTDSGLLYIIEQHYDCNAPKGRKYWFEVYHRNVLFGSDLGRLNKNMQINIDLVPYDVTDIVWNS